MFDILYKLTFIFLSVTQVSKNIEDCFWDNDFLQRGSARLHLLDEKQCYEVLLQF